MKGINFFSSVDRIIDQGTSSVVASSCCLVELLLACGPFSQDFLAFSMSQAKEVFMLF